MTWRAAARVDREVAVLWAVCAAGCLALRPVWLAAAGLLPACLWHVWTGLPCPGCGTTRAIVHLLLGEIVAAFAMNPLAAGAAVAFVAGGLVAPLWLGLGGLVPVVPAQPRPAWALATFAMVTTNWAWLWASSV